MADRREVLLAAAETALEVASVSWHSEVTTKPTGLQVARQKARQTDRDGLPEVCVLYLGEGLSRFGESSTDVSERTVQVGVRVRAEAESTTNETGDAALFPVLQWAEIALLNNNFGSLGGVALKGELVRIDQVDAMEHADVYAEALMRFEFTIQTKWGDPRQVP